MTSQVTHAPSVYVLSYAYNSNIPTWLMTQPPVANSFPNPAQSIMALKWQATNFNCRQATQTAWMKASARVRLHSQQRATAQRAISIP